MGPWWLKGSHVLCYLTVSFLPVRSSSIYTNWHQWDVFLRLLCVININMAILHQCPLNTLPIFLESLVQGSLSIVQRILKAPPLCCCTFNTKNGIYVPGDYCYQCLSFHIDWSYGGEAHLDFIHCLLKAFYPRTQSGFQRRLSQRITE